MFCCCVVFGCVFCWAIGFLLWCFAVRLTTSVDDLVCLFGHLLFLLRVLFAIACDYVGGCFLCCVLLVCCVFLLFDYLLFDLAAMLFIGLFCCWFGVGVLFVVYVSVVIACFILFGVCLLITFWFAVGLPCFRFVLL